MKTFRTIGTPNKRKLRENVRIQIVDSHSSTYHIIHIDFPKNLKGTIFVHRFDQTYMDSLVKGRLTDKSSHDLENDVDPIAHGRWYLVTSSH